MPDEYLILDDAALIQQCEVDCYRASGPGGQKRNKTSSAVRLRHQPTGLAAIANEDRSQHVNKRRALRRLRETIALEVRGEVDVEHYRPSKRLEDCISKDGRILVGQRDERYSLIVSEILDLLAAAEMRVSRAAEMIGVSTAHLVQFLLSQAHVSQRVNQMRAAVGAKPLRKSG